MANMTESEVALAGLKKKVGLAYWKVGQVKEANQSLVNFSAKLIADQIETQPKSYIDAKVWELVAMAGLTVEVESSRLGIFTEIKDYENKRGHTHKAHFIFGKYSKKAEDGDKPESFMMNTQATPELCDYDMLCLETKGILQFKVKPLKSNSR